MKELSTTLNKMRDCMEEWEKLLHPLGKTEADDEPLSLVTILENNDLVAAQYALMTVREYDNSLRLYACYCAMSVLPIFENLYPDDKRLRQSIETVERFAKGQANEAELDFTGSVAMDATRFAAQSVGLFVARSAARASKEVTAAIHEALCVNAEHAATWMVADVAEDAANSIKKTWETADAAFGAARAVFNSTARGDENAATATARFMAWAALDAYVVTTDKATMEREFIRLCRLEGEYGVVAAREQGEQQ